MKTLNFIKIPYFNLDVPDKIAGVPVDLLYPERTWQNHAAYIKVSRSVKHDFEENYKKFDCFLPIENVPIQFYPG